MCDWKIKQKDIQVLEKEVFAAKGAFEIETNLEDGKMSVKPQAQINRSKVFGILARLFRKQRSIDSHQLQFCLQKVDPKDAEVERNILMREYEITQEIGKHWDLLRWNVSKFFLSIQTLFIAGAAKGLLDMTTETPGSSKHSLLSIGIQMLAGMNIILCLIWFARNKGIHAWHKASTKRVLLIESDPRLRGCLKHITSVIHGMRQREGFPGINLHGTGELESWGPPVVFMIFWAAIFVISKWFRIN